MKLKGVGLETFDMPCSTRLKERIDCDDKVVVIGNTMECSMERSMVSVDQRFVLSSSVLRLVAL